MTLDIMQNIITIDGIFQFSCLASSSVMIKITARRITVTGIEIIHPTHETYAIPNPKLNVKKKIMIL